MNPTSNPFGSLVSGLQPNLNTPKFQFLNNYGANMSTPSGPAKGAVGTLGTAPTVSTPKASYVASLSGSTPTSTPTSTPVPKSTQVSGGNSSATAPTPKSTFVNSQVNNSPDQNVPAGPNTAGYTYVGGKLTTVGGQPVGSTAPSGSSSDPASLVNANPPPGFTPTGTTPQITPQSQYNQAFQTYLDSLKPGADESLASKNLAALQLQASKDQDTALERPGQTSAFATGEAARVARNNAYQIDADTNTVNAETNARTAQQTAAKAALDFAKTNLPSNDPFNLSPGETRYGPDGKVIAQAPATATKPNIIGDSSTGYYTVGADGKLTKLLGAAPKALNQNQSTAQAYSQINQLLGMTDSKGVPYVDNNGYFTPQGFKSIVQNAIEDGISRADILSEYGDKIFPGNAKAYGLTPKELTDLGIS